MNFSPACHYTTVQVSFEPRVESGNPIYAASPSSGGVDGSQHLQVNSRERKNLQIRSVICKCRGVFAFSCPPRQFQAFLPKHESDARNWYIFNFASNSVFALFFSLFFPVVFVCYFFDRYYIYIGLIVKKETKTKSRRVFGFFFRKFSLRVPSFRSQITEKTKTT